MTSFGTISQTMSENNIVSLFLRWAVCGLAAALGCAFLVVGVIDYKRSVLPFNEAESRFGAAFARHDMRGQIAAVHDECEALKKAIFFAGDPFCHCDTR